MKKAIALLSLMSLSFLGFGQSWPLDKDHAKIGFTVKHHMISEVDGYFRTFTTMLTSSKEDFSDAVFELTAKTASINTENKERDKDLRGADFFDVKKFPTLTFKSTSFKKTGANKYSLVGDLTIKDVTKTITMDVTLIGPVPNPGNKKPSIGIKALCKVNRKDFGIGPNLPEFLVGNEVELRATGEFNKD